MFKDIDHSTWKYLIISAFLLLPVIFFPISTDLSAFIQGGRILADGGNLFEDFFDVKPPFLYYLFSVLAFFFDDNLLLYRVFEYFNVLFALYISSYFFSKLEIQSKVINLFIVLYSIVYITLNYTNTFQTETLLFIPSIFYFYYILSAERNKKFALLSGLILGLIVGLKYTFGVLLFASILFDLLINQNSRNTLIKFYAIQILTMSLVVISFFIPITIQGNWQNFIDYNIYLSSYISNNDLIFGSYSSIYNAITNNFIEFISPVLFALFLFSFYFSTYKNNKYKNIYILSLIVFLLLFITVLLESKFFIYHFVRFYPFFIIVCCLSFYELIKPFKLNHFVVNISFICVCLFFSPLPRYINGLNNTLNYFVNNDKYLNKYENSQKKIFHKTNLITADYINTNYPDKDILVINTSNNSIINMLDKMPLNSFAHSAFYLSDYSNNNLKRIFENNLKNSKVLIIQINDNTPQVFLNNKSSKDHLLMNKKYSSMIESRFELDTLINNTFEVYKEKIQID